MTETSVYIDPLLDICLECPLPDCYDRNPRCPRREAEYVPTVPDGHYTTDQVMAMTGLGRYMVTTYFSRVAAIGAFKQRVNGTGGASWIVPRAGVEWMQENLLRNGRK